MDTANRRHYQRKEVYRYDKWNSLHARWHHHVQAGQPACCQWRLHPSAIKADHGNDYLSHVPKYDGFCTVPSHTDYQPTIGCFLNLYQPIGHVPTEGEFPHIKSLVRHIFGEQYDLGVDYLQLLYLNPVQKLPILLLVSEERNTGKTTFSTF